jgi:hypothetical protein
MFLYGNATTLSFTYFDWAQLVLVLVVAAALISVLQFGTSHVIGTDKSQKHSKQESTNPTSPFAWLEREEPIRLPTDERMGRYAQRTARSYPDRV